MGTWQGSNYGLHVDGSLEPWTWGPGKVYFADVFALQDFWLGDRKLQFIFFILPSRLYRPFARKPWLTVYRAHTGLKIVILVALFLECIGNAHCCFAF